MGTADGIEDKDWDHLTDLAARLCDAIGSGQEQASRREFWACLDEMEGKYGPLPSLLSTRGDFSEDYDEKEHLLHRAYDGAVTAGDAKNLLYIAHSLTELYMELVSVEAAQKWLDRLDAHLHDFYDPACAEDAMNFRQTLERLKNP
jgi:hypothetical protein